MRRIVIKVGSAVITQDEELALDRLSKLVELIYDLKKQGDEIILVSSGAVAAGHTIIQLDKSIISQKQTLAAVGQSLLMQTYIKKFNEYDITCSQILLEASIFKDATRLNHAKDAINEMLKHNIVPVINENDVTAIDELVFGDNDQLAAYVTHNFNSDFLVILTDVDGYYNNNPRTHKDAKLQQYVNKIDNSLLILKHNAHNQFATGGITTKLKAAHFLLKYNKAMYLTTGFDLKYVKEYLLNNIHTKGTLFKK
ncbi:Glutamate 5-kinase [hydrothermal vent metagenome]|uniref:Glutamate 5-kinase n=1 Tax=hydrothermal vent metagenome TaxID=652676 RepID=A0A3B1E1U4_9ZZZZ